MSAVAATASLHVQRPPTSPSLPATVEVPASAEEVTPDILLSFEDDSVESRIPLSLAPSKLASFEYFAALLSGRWPTTGAFAVPVDRGVFMALLAIMATGDLPPLMPPTDALLFALHAAADEMGADDAVLSMLLPPALPTTRLPYRADLYALCPAWWHADAEEEDRMARGVSADDALVRVDSAFAAQLLYSPLKKTGGLWLFSDQPLFVPETYTGIPVLVE